MLKQMLKPFARALTVSNWLNEKPYVNASIEAVLSVFSVQANILSTNAEVLQSTSSKFASFSDSAKKREFDFDLVASTEHEETRSP